MLAQVEDVWRIVNEDKYCITFIEQQQQKLHFCDNNCVWINARAKKVNGKRMNGLREKIKMHFNLMGKI